MKYFWILIFVLLGNSLFAQKIKAKKGTVIIDDVERFKMEKKSTYNTEIYTIKSLSDKPLFGIEYKRKYAYWEGPHITYFVLTDATKSDSCLIDYRSNSGNKKIAKFIYTNDMIVNNELAPSSFDEIKAKINQDIITDFMKGHELSFDKLVERSPNALIKLSFSGEKFRHKIKYRIYVGESVSSKTIGYVVVEAPEFGNITEEISIYLPNELKIAECTATSSVSNPKIKRIKSVKSMVDQRQHRINQSLSPTGILAILELLARNGYL